jgi:hypothetical protein
MTDLKNLTILGLLGRLNMLIDEGQAALPPREVQKRIADGTILRHLAGLYGDFPEFSPVHQIEGVLLLRELQAVLDLYDGREETKMGVQNNGLCLLVGYCVELLVQRNIREVLD